MLTNTLKKLIFLARNSKKLPQSSKVDLNDKNES